jgi:O-antigen/teichoic acid export membrane protein
MLAFGYERAWSKVITQSLVVNFLLLAILMQIMLPARAVALTTSLTDVFVMLSCMRFFLKKGKILSQESLDIQQSPSV